jgi:hypothetical protein
MLTSGWIVAVAAMVCWFWQTRKTSRAETLAQYWQNQVRVWAEDAELVRGRLTEQEEQLEDVRTERDMLALRVAELEESRAATKH